MITMVIQMEISLYGDDDDEDEEKDDDDDDMGSCSGRQLICNGGRLLLTPTIG